MKKIISALLVLILLSVTPAAAYSKPKVALNPANHKNPGAIRGYTEAAGMVDLAKLTKRYALKNDIKTEIFFDGYRNGGGISSLKREVSRANAHGSTLFVAMHSDGVPKPRGIFVLYKNGAGKHAGRIIGGHIAKKMGLKFEGVSHRPNLYVLRQSKSPAILIEYLSHANLQDNRKLNDNNYRRKLAEATVEGIAIYNGIKIKPKGPANNVKPVQTSSKPVRTNAKPEQKTVTQMTVIDDRLKPKTVGEGSDNGEAKQNIVKNIVKNTTKRQDKIAEVSPKQKPSDVFKQKKQNDNRKGSGLIDIIDRELKFKPVTKSSEKIDDDLLVADEAIEKTPSLLKNGLNNSVNYLKTAVGLNF